MDNDTNTNTESARIETTTTRRVFGSPEMRKIVIELARGLKSSDAWVAMEEQLDSMISECDSDTLAQAFDKEPSEEAHILLSDLIAESVLDHLDS